MFFPMARVRLTPGRLCFTLAAIPVCVHAQQVPSGAESGGSVAGSTSGANTVVVTAARLPQQLQDVVPDTTVLTRADIEQSQTTDLVELLSRQAGIEYAQLGGPGRQASIFMRGTNSSQVLVLVDGVPLNSSLDGAPALGRVTLDSVERIEIVRGNLSSLYGSSAIGGVIQVFTRDYSKPGAQAQAEFGERGTRDASGSVGTHLPGVNLTASVGWREQNAISAINAGQVIISPPFTLGANPGTDPTRNVDGSLMLSHRDDANELSAWTWASHSDTSFDSTSDGPNAGHIERASFDLLGASARHHFGSLGSVALTYGQSRDISVDDYQPGDLAIDSATSFTAGRFEARNRDVTLQGDAKLLPGVQLQAGVTRLDQRGGTTQFDPTFAGIAFVAFERRVDSAWLGTIASFGRNELQLNGRYDRYSDFGHVKTGLAGWSFALAPRLRAVAQWSNAFRAPSFNDLYFPGFSNPKLQPEHSRTEELGLRFRQERVNASLNLYRTRTDGLIVFNQVTSQPDNIGHAAIDGAELQGQVTFAPWSFGGNVGLMHARDADTGLSLVRRARDTARLSVAWDQAPWRAAVDVSRSGARDDLDINTSLRTQLAPYTLARLTAERSILPWIKVRLRVENLFNAHYQLVDGYNTLPRMVIGGVEAHI